MTDVFVFLYTAPQQREAVATMSKIQDEAYTYALQTMKNYSISAREVKKIFNKIHIRCVLQLLPAHEKPRQSFPASEF